MPYFFAGLAWFIGTYMSKILFRGAVALGIGFGSYQGLTWVLDQVIAQVQGQLSSLPADMLNMVTLLKLDQGISVVLSAYAIVAFLAASRVLLRRLTGG